MQDTPTEDQIELAVKKVLESVVGDKTVYKRSEAELWSKEILSLIKKRLISINDQYTYTLSMSIFAKARSFDKKPILDCSNSAHDKEVCIEWEKVGITILVIVCLERRILEHSKRSLDYKTDARVLKMLKLCVIQRVCKRLLKKAYGSNVDILEDKLENIINAYEKNQDLLDEIVSNEETNLNKHVDDIIMKLSEDECSRTGSHDFDSAIALSELFMCFGDWRVCAEMIWLAVHISIQDFVRDQEITVDIETHEKKNKFTMMLSLHIRQAFAHLGEAHRGFYKDHLDLDEIKGSLLSAKDFNRSLKSTNLTDEEKKLIETKFPK